MIPTDASEVVLRRVLEGLVAGAEAQMRAAIAPLLAVLDGTDDDSAIRSHFEEEIARQELRIKAALERAVTAAMATAVAANDARLESMRQMLAAGFAAQAATWTRGPAQASHGFTVPADHHIH